LFRPHVIIFIANSWIGQLCSDQNTCTHQTDGLHSIIFVGQARSYVTINSIPPRHLHPGSLGYHF
jgi:hypothetical protein